MRNKIISWILEHILLVLLKLNRHIKIIDNKVCFVCPEDPDPPVEIFDADFKEID